MADIVKNLSGAADLYLRRLDYLSGGDYSKQIRRVLGDACRVGSGLGEEDALQVVADHPVVVGLIKDQPVQGFSAGGFCLLDVPR